MTTASPDQSAKLPDSAALNRAFESLKTYGPGSDRALLLPLDNAVASAGTDLPLRKNLEPRLLAALEGCESAVAREYICSKLALVGSAASVRPLARWLDDPQLACPACNALQALPGPEASNALRKSLTTLQGSLRIGPINSLGARRDSGSIRALTALLRDPDWAVISAAAAALGQIGTSKAANVLRAFQRQAPKAVAPQLADALLVCGEKLVAEARPSEARSVYALLVGPENSPHIREAAQRGLRACGG